MAAGPNEQNFGSLVVRAEGKTVELSRESTYTIGRAADCALILDNPRVSRVHLQLSWDGHRWIADDPGSSNGTWLGSQPQTNLAIENDVVLVLGGDRGAEIHLSPKADAGSMNAVAPEPASTGRHGVPPIYVEPEGRGVRAQPADNQPVGGYRFSELSQVIDSNLFVETQALAPAGSTISVGRGPTNTVSLTDDLLVSRRHAELQLDGADSGTLRDIGSSNGTYVDGERITTATITSDSVITVGNTNLVLRNGQLVEFRDSGLLSFGLRDLTVTANDGQPILDAVSVDIPARSLVGVLGPSGAGKSTLVKAIVGAVPVRSGKVLYGGVDLVSQLTATRRSIGYVPQDDILHGQLTVTQTLTYAARLRLASDATADEIEALLERVLAELSLTGHEHKRVDQLSGGQRKRVSTAMELLTSPPLLVLDEPSSGLDPGNEMTLMELLASLANQDNTDPNSNDPDHDDTGRRVLVVTHSVQSLQQCDYLLVLAPGGHLAFFGRPADLCEYFEVDQAAEVFQRLENEPIDWTAKFESSSHSQGLVHVEPALAKTVELPKAPPALKWTTQFRLLVSRYARIVFGDRANALLLAAQAPVIGLMLALISSDAFSPPEGQAPSRVLLLLLGLTLSITYLGASNSVREVVKERAIFQRERALGLSASAYIVSKLAILGLITVGQALLLFFIGTSTAGQPFADALVLPGGARTEVMAFIVLTGLAAVALGLLVSALVDSADKAMTLLPVALLGMYLLSGGPTNLEDTPGLREVSQINSVRWGLAGAAKSVDAKSILFCPEVIDSSASERCRTSWNRSSSGVIIDASMLVVLTAVATGGAIWALRRRRY